MRNYVVVTFASEERATEGLQAFEHLDAEGAITVHEAAVVECAPDGTIVPRRFRTSEPTLRRPGIGVLLGVLAGLPGGPIGVVVGGAVGVLGGAIDEAMRWEASDEHLERIGEHMKTGTFAVLADVHENESGPVDSRMSELGGSILRESRKDLFEHLLDKRQETRRAAGSSTSGGSSS